VRAITVLVRSPRVVLAYVTTTVEESCGENPNLGVSFLIATSILSSHHVNVIVSVSGHRFARRSTLVLFLPRQLQATTNDDQTPCLRCHLATHTISALLHYYPPATQFIQSVAAPDWRSNRNRPRDYHCTRKWTTTIAFHGTTADENGFL
jgi:hypothetical protein